MQVREGEKAKISCIFRSTRAVEAGSLVGLLKNIQGHSQGYVPKDTKVLGEVFSTLDPFPIAIFRNHGPGTAISFKISTFLVCTVAWQLTPWPISVHWREAQGQKSEPRCQ